MSAWVKQHFRDEKNARETIAVSVVVAAVVGLLVVLLGLFLSTH